MKTGKLLVTGLWAVLVFNFGCINSPKTSHAESSFNETKNKTEMTTNHLTNFGKKYAKAWCSQNPDSVAAFFSNNGSLTVNKDSPAIGRAAISMVASGFMTAFPDMVVSMDSLTTTANGTEFHWTLTGTNSGPNGTGKKIKISGIEIWQIDSDELIRESRGSFDAEEYNRQLKYGVNN